VLKLPTISTYLSYFVSLIAFLFGVVVISGVAFQNVPGKLRVIFGIVLMLWGIYRFVATRFQVRKQNDKDEDE
jgi:xanthine/uracil permease